MKKRVSCRLIQWSVAALCAGMSTNSFASGFQLFEVNGAGTGDYYASGAATSNDASAAFFNPAALATMKNPQAQVSGVNIIPDISFTGSNTLNAAGITTYRGTAQGGAYAFVPSLEVAAPFNDEMYWGLSIAVPFGLDTNFNQNDFVRYAATETEVQVIDISPSVGFKVTDKFSVGFGVDADRLSATLNSTAGVVFLGPGADTQSFNQANGWGYGWHAGALYQFSPDTRVGFGYHSKVSYSITGTSTLTGPLANGSIANNMLSADTTLPAYSMLSAFHQFNSQWGGEASVTYTQWGVFDSLTLHNVQSIPTPISVTIPQGFRNTWRGALGATYKPCNQWLFRAGLGYDQTPTTSPDRNVRLPDGNRVAAALGAHYQATKQFGLDVGWTHLFFNDGAVAVTQTTGSQVTTVLGKAESRADLIGVQLTVDFV